MLLNHFRSIEKITAKKVPVDIKDENGEFVKT
jgi:solute carrier family 8 (sodium/calcium exchanger)